MNQQTNEHIDLVVTYVDGNEPVWRSNLSQFNNNYNKLRFRNWNLMRFWFRGIEKNMPFIHNIYFVVSNIEQVPNWINRRHVNVVLHADIIPKQLLPTFTSTTIEMFLHKIPNLSEKFIYSNDDTFANNSILPEYFFTEQGLTRHTLKKKDSAKNAKQEKKKSFFQGVKQEWNKIVWPTRDDLTKQTALVIVISVAMGSIITLFDSAALQLVNWLMSI